MGQSASQEELNCQLWVACESSDIAHAKKLLKQGANPQAADQHGNTALHKAAKVGSIPLVEQLLQSKKCDVNAPNARGNTPVMIAATARHYELVELLINEYNASINVTNSRHMNLLHIICRYASLDTMADALMCVKLLLDRNLSPLATTADGMNALHVATVFSPSTALLEVILSRAPEYVDTPTVEPMPPPIRRSSSSSLDLNFHDTSNGERRASISPTHSQNLSANGFISTPGSVTCLYLACQRGDLDFVRVLLRYGANPSAKCTQGLTPLHVAASLGHDAIVKELVDLNNENAYSNPYFRIALPIDVMAEKTHDNSIESEEQPTDTTASTESTDVNAERDLSQDAMGVFPKQRVDINAQDDLGNTPLIYAVVRKSTYITKLLLEGNAEPNLANKKGLTPLHYHSCQESILELLLSVNADVNIVSSAPAIPNGVGLTPLHVACEYGGPLSIVQALLQKDRSTVNVAGVAGVTPLHTSAALPNAALAKVLLDAGANVNSISNDGFTPLHTAIQHGSLEIVKLLIANGADINVCAQFNEEAPHVIVPPLYLACCNGDVEIVRALLKNGAAKSVDWLSPDGFAALHITAAKGDLAITKMLLKAGASPDLAGQPSLKTPLFAAIENSQTHIVHYLLKFYRDRINLSAKDADGLTPLHVAASCQSLPSLRLLLAAGADPNVPGPQSVPPIISACLVKGNVPIVRALVHAGADVNYTYSPEEGYKLSPLLIAVLQDDIELCKYLLLDARADTQSLDDDIREQLAQFAQTVLQEEKVHRTLQAPDGLRSALTTAKASMVFRSPPSLSPPSLSPPGSPQRSPPSSPLHIPMNPWTAPRVTRSSVVSSENQLDLEKGDDEFGASDSEERSHLADSDNSINALDLIQRATEEPEESEQTRNEKLEQTKAILSLNVPHLQNEAHSPPEQQLAESLLSSDEQPEHGGDCANQSNLDRDYDSEDYSTELKTIDDVIHSD